jgi:branched-subunit amino acid aminotransferase/4-amino-4-deoxychorismate lyase
MSTQKDIYWVNLDGHWVQESEAMVPVENRGLMYGDGLFETILYHQGRLMVLESHLNRFFYGLNHLGLSFPISKDELSRMLIDGVHRNHLQHQDVIIRLQCWRQGGRGYAANTSKVHYYVSFKPSKPSLEDSPKGIRLFQSSVPLAPKKPGECMVKSSNALRYVLAANEAIANDYDDALLLSSEGYVAEVSSANIFWLKSNDLFTPSLACHILRGTRRDALINKVTSARTYQIIEGEFHANELFDADLVFTLNSIQGLRWVKSLNQTELEVAHDQLEDLTKLYYEALLR